jgi:hypothetical protein
VRYVAVLISHRNVIKEDGQVTRPAVDILKELV